MNSLKCEKVMNSFFELDKGERLELVDSIHLLFCKDCRTKVRLLTKSEKLAEKTLNLPVFNSGKSLAQLIKETRPQWLKIKPVSMTRWILGGSFMLLFFIFSGHFLNKTQNQTYLIWFYLIFSVFVSSYCAAFIGTNMDFFIKKIDTKRFSHF